jgi:GTP-binding protein EngB required for normal cell division
MATICVLVDATRGVADDDAELLALLHVAQRPHRLVLTKGDLLDAGQLARCAQLVQGDWHHLRQAADRATFGHASSSAGAGAAKAAGKALAVACVSGHTGAGVTALWKSLVAAAQRVSVYKSGPNGVPTHVSAVA